MSKPIQKPPAFLRKQEGGLLAIGVAVALSAGCQEQELSADKKGRVIAAENIQLKKELKQRDQEIEKLKKEHEKQIQQQKELLAKYLKRKEDLEKQLQQNVKEQIDEVLAAVIDENAKLREEIKKRKAQIEKLKTELDERTKVKVRPLQEP